MVEHSNSASDASPVAIQGPSLRAAISTSICDAALGSVLSFTYIASRTVVVQARQIGLIAFLGLVIGTATFNRGFALLSLGPVYVTEVCLALMCLTTLAELSKKRIQFLPTDRVARVVAFAVLGYLAWGFLRLVPDLLAPTLLATIRNFALVYYASFCILTWTTIQKSDVEWVIRVVLGAIVLLSTVTNTVTVALFYLQEGATDDPNLKVIQGQAAVFALLSVVILITLIRFHAFARMPLLPQIAGGLLIVNLLFVYLSGHRSAFIAVGAGVGVLVLAKERRKINLMKGALAFGVFALLLVLAWKFVAPSVGVLAEKYQTIFTPTEEANAAWRLEFWIAMVSLWSSAPIAGVGFAYDFINVEPWGLVEEHYDPHNSYLAILARVGVIGIVLMIVCLVSGCVLFTRIMRSSGSPKKRMLAACLFSSFVAIAVFATANVTLESPYHAIFLWIFAGLGIALSQSAVQGPVPS